MASRTSLKVEAPHRLLLLLSPAWHVGRGRNLLISAQHTMTSSSTGRAVTSPDTQLCSPAANSLPTNADL